MRVIASSGMLFLSLFFDLDVYTPNYEKMPLEGLILAQSERWRRG